MLTKNKTSEHSLTLSFENSTSVSSTESGFILDTDRSLSLFHSMLPGHEAIQAFCLDKTGESYPNINLLELEYGI
jgi:hypothetical protein